MKCALISEVLLICCIIKNFKRAIGLNIRFIVKGRSQDWAYCGPVLITAQYSGYFMIYEWFDLETFIELVSGIDKEPKQYRQKTEVCSFDHSFI